MSCLFVCCFLSRNSSVTVKVETSRGNISARDVTDSWELKSSSGHLISLDCLDRARKKKPQFSNMSREEQSRYGQKVLL